MGVYAHVLLRELLLDGVFSIIRVLVRDIYAGNSSRCQARAFKPLFFSWRLIAFVERTDIMA